MKNFSLSFVALSLVVAFSGSANAAETSMNGWGKAYAQAAAKQSEVTANAQANLKVEANHSDDTNFRSSGDQAGSFIAATGAELANAADRLKTTAASTATAAGNQLKAQGSALAAKMSESKPGAPEASVQANAAASASATLGRNVNGSGRATADIVATAGRATPRAEKPQTAMPEAPKSDMPKSEMPKQEAPAAQAPQNESPMANAAQNKPAQPKMAKMNNTDQAPQAPQEPTAQNEPMPESDNTAQAPES
nr:hypothetical protein [Burkholderiales bacterium]